MGEKSKIEWTDHTFNPWVGCTKISAGCTHCYAEREMTRKPRWANTWGVNGTRVITSEAYWNKPLVWNRQSEARVFCGSLCDIFDDHPSIESKWRVTLWDLIWETPNLTWLLLTKRPENIYRYCTEYPLKFPDNVWLGVSVEDQEQADKRIPVLMQLPAAVRFVSCEPLLGGIDFCGANVDWVIVGGESGHQARKMHPSWVDRIFNQCKQNYVAFFFKQWGEYYPVYIGGELQFRKVGKKIAGRTLYGREWDEFPTTKNN